MHGLKMTGTSLDNIYLSAYSKLGGKKIWTTSSAEDFTSRKEGIIKKTVHSSSEIEEGISC